MNTRREVNIDPYFLHQTAVAEIFLIYHKKRMCVVVFFSQINKERPSHARTEITCIDMYCIGGATYFLYLYQQD